MSTRPPKSPPTTHRINGRLHTVHPVLDEAGNLLTSVTRALKVEFHPEDLVQLIVGASVMALPIALTGEVWDLGETLSVGRTVAIAGISVVTLAAFIWSLFYVRNLRAYRGTFLLRVVTAYLVTSLIAFTFLYLFDKAPLDDLQVALTRTVLVSLPAAYAATAVDFVK